MHRRQRLFNYLDSLDLIYYIKRNVVGFACVFVCVCHNVFVLYSRPHCLTDHGETFREGGYQAGIGLDEIKYLLSPRVPELFKEYTRFFGKNSPLAALDF